MSHGINRRQFIRVSVIGAGTVSAASLVGCGGSSGGGQSGDFTPTAAPFSQSVMSGDPRTDSIILWTRVDVAGGGAVSVDVQVSEEETFSNPVVAASVSSDASNDHCVKVKVTGLDEASTYYYRFVYDGNFSPIGRFRTARPDTDTTPARFAFVSCQDYTGRFYNSLLRLLDADMDDLDFVLHLGDYVYETTGDPGFQAQDGRRVSFTDEAGAIQLGTPEAPFFAARSLSNYRELYKTYRSDAALQRLHERFAVVAIWDDHEFSDDSWQSNATFFDGREDEQDEQRRSDSARAYFEYMPIDLDPATGQPVSVMGNDTILPSGANQVTGVNRQFRFGAHVNLTLADYRTFRPDHVIAEDAFPGTVVMDQDQTVQTLVATGAAPDAASALAFAQANFFPYIDLDDMANQERRDALQFAAFLGYRGEGIEATEASARAQAVAQGKVAVIVFNTFMDQITPLSSNAQNLKVTDTSGLEVGVSWAMMGKQDLFNSTGARYFVVKDIYDLYSAYLALLVGDTDFDNAWGDLQTGAIMNSLLSHPATWQILGSSVSFTSLILDPSLDTALEQAFVDGDLPITNFYLNCEHWDGFPIRRQVLMGDQPSPLPTTLKGSNVVLLSGDIHASYVTDHGVDGGNNRAVEFTVTSVSSGTFSELVQSTARGLAALQTADGEQVVNDIPQTIDPLLQGANDKLKFARSTANGVAVLTATADSLEVEYFHVAADQVSSERYSQGVALLETRRFMVPKMGGQNGEVVEV